MHANRTFFLSHTLHTRTRHGSFPGEIANSIKLANLMGKNGFPVEEILDVYELFPQRDEFEKLAFLNCALAEEGHPICEAHHLDETKAVIQKIAAKNPSHLFFLTWNTNLAALFATGIQKKLPTCSKLYVDHPNQNVLAPLYEPATLLLTESLLANERGAASGIPLWKMIHLPNHYPAHYEQLTTSRAYVESKRPISKETCIIGVISRLEYRKNVEFALRAVKKLDEEGHDVLLVLKGDFEEGSSYPAYMEWIKDLMKKVEGEKWLLWDRKPIPFSEIEKVYASFDIFLHLSGSEAGSNVIVEAMSLGLPTLILDGSVNPSLFQGGVLFVNHDGSPPVDVIRPFNVPCENDLLEKLRLTVLDQKMRQEWAVKAKTAAKKRFSPQITIDRLGLIYKAMNAYFSGERIQDNIKKEIEALYQEDCKRYEA